MATWICKACGYMHQGDEAPERCPICGASKAMFYQEKKKNYGCAYNILLLILIPVAVFLSLFSCKSSPSADNPAARTASRTKAHLRQNSILADNPLAPPSRTAGEMVRSVFRKKGRV